MNRKAFMIALGALTMSLACFGYDGSQGQDNSQSMRTNLAGPAIGHEAPKGHAEFKSDPTKKRTELTVEVEDVNLADGTVLTVSIVDNGTSTAAGTIKLKGQSAELELRSQDGDSVPVVKKGDMVVVSNGAAAIVSGIF